MAYGISPPGSVVRFDPRIRGGGGGGATRIAAPQGVVDMEVTSSSMSSVMEPQSVPSRISMVLVEEAKVRETEYLVSPRVDKDPRLLADVASPASVTVDNGSYMLPCVVGTLSPSDSVGPVGPCVGCFPRLTLNLLALLAHMGCCPRLTLTLLAPLARVGHCPQLTLNLLARMGRCPRLTLIMLALLAHMGRCPHLTLLL